VDILAEADALLAQGQPKRAIALLNRAIAEGRGGLLSRVRLGRAHLVNCDPPAALEVLREVSVLAPGMADAVLALGEALMAAGHLPAAVAEFQRAARLDPDFVAAHYALGLAWFDAGEPDKALDIFRPIAEAESPLAQSAARKIAEARAMKTAERAPAGYVRHLFDQFSYDYDARMLGELDYRAHDILRAFAGLLLGDAANLDILDLGCGTGLCGASFKDLAGRLDGVDLSPRMIEKARSRGIYDALLVSDIETLLDGDGPAYDLLLAADSLVYLGALAPIFSAAVRRLRPGGFFLFTLERKDGEGYELGEKRRYRHSEAYVRVEASRTGLEPMGLMHCSPRMEAHRPVEGLAVALQLPRKLG
jgi:predicted TPR repeat methyltransferase